MGDKMYLRGVEKATGQNILFFDVNEYENLLLQDNFTLKNVEIIKKYPNTLVIKIDVKEPFAILKGKNALNVSDDGTVLARTSDQKIDRLPIINTNGDSYRIGEKVAGSIVMLLRIMKEIEKTGTITTVRIDADRQIATFVLLDDTQIIVSLTKNNPDIAASLQIIAARFRIEGRQLGTIDFRFEKPIITLLSGEKITPK